MYSNNGTTVTLTIKHWLWSDGQPVTVRDLMFWINILKANESQWSDYTPGVPGQRDLIQDQGGYHPGDEPQQGVRA